MNFIFLDFETYYDREYTLKKLTPAEYVLDPRFECICVAVNVNGTGTQVIDGPDFPAWLAQYPPEDTVTVTFNALFDNFILAVRYGYVPSRMIDALGMARALLGHKLRSLSLAKVAEHLGLPAKGTTIANVIGMNRAAIKAQPALWLEFMDYAKTDCDLLYKIWKILHPQFPEPEYRVMDLVLRTTCVPRFHIDKDMLAAHLSKLRLDKTNLLASCGADKADLMSGPKFQKMLEDLGVEVAMKAGKSGRMIPCLAKTDEFMADLREHPDVRVQALAAARLGFKSTIEETRAERLLAIANLSWPSYCDGNMPIPLRYAGAHTHRLSGDWRMNMQNMPRGSTLRDALKCAPGHSIIVADLGQIEARLTAWLCHDTFLMDQFTNGLDPYKMLASLIFHVPVEQVNKLQRFIGKSGVLGLGFGAGHEKFYAMVVRSARAMGMDMDELLAVWTPELAEKTVKVYRVANASICNVWRLLDGVLGMQWSGLNGTAQLGPCVIGYGTVTAPGGLVMRYNVEKPTQDFAGRTRRTFSYGGRAHDIYGSKFLENIIQFLARVILFNTALRLNCLKYPFALQCHDELVFIVPDHDVENAKQIIHREMTRRPTWAPDLPLTAEVEVGQSYGEAK